MERKDLEKETKKINNIIMNLKMDQKLKFHPNFPQNTIIIVIAMV